MQFRFASILFISLVLFIVFPCGRAFAENVQDLQLSLSLEKSKYAIGEPIIVKEEIKNVGSEPVLVCVGYIVWGNQEYKGPGDNAPKIATSDGLLPTAIPRDAFIEIKPGATHNRHYDLARFLEFVKGHDRRSDQSGDWEYKVTNYYGYNGQHLGLKAWTGVLQSNNIHFKITKE